ncbi:uncharacterized protein [Solanum lycopersicum]|uniref:uncharacterized protein isoform X1 n=1 Tax=Solanum lycopersicum TaxID=4081 RepID=UPI000E1CDC57|nr:uncharacterized protein LOC101266760 isoform X1 [Solanum lycopersicum]
MSGMEDGAEKSNPSTQQEEEVVKKKYGGMIPKKPPLISKVSHSICLLDCYCDWWHSKYQHFFVSIASICVKNHLFCLQDHERAYFDSADWALGKQGADKKPKGPLEALRPKLQPTQQQTRYRKSPCAPSEGEDGIAPSEDPTANE